MSSPWLTSSATCYQVPIGSIYTAVLNKQLLASCVHSSVFWKAFLNSCFLLYYILSSSCPSFRFWKTWLQKSLWIPWKTILICEMGRLVFVRTHYMSGLNHLQVLEGVGPLSCKIFSWNQSQVQSHAVIMWLKMVSYKSNSILNLLNYQYYQSVL